MKRQLNVTFLGWLVIPLIFLAIGSYFLWSFQTNRNARKLFDRGVELEKENDLNQATAYLQRFLNYRPNDTEALTRYGFLIDKSAGNNVASRLSAVPVLEKALRLLVVNAEIAREEGKPEQAQQDAEQAAKVRRALGDILLEAGPLNKEYYPQAQTYFDWLTDEENKGEGAQPDDPELLIRKGMAHGGQDDYLPAIAAFDKAIALDPENVEAPLAKAMTMRAHRDPLRDPEAIAQEADALIDALVEAHPSVKTHMARLRYRNTYGNPKGALEDARAAVKLDPDDTAAMIYTAILEFEQGQDVDEARALLGKAIEKEPTKLDAYAVLIELERRYRRYGAAEEVARKGIRNVPNSEGNLVAELYWTLANILIEAREPEKADDLITHFLKGQSILSLPLLAYLDGRVLMLQGKWPEARDKIEIALAQILQIPRVASDAQIDLATCYSQLALKEPTHQEEYKAKRMANLNSAVRANPNSFRARVTLAQAISEDESLDRETRLRRVEETLSSVKGSTADILVMRAMLAAGAELRKPAPKRTWDQIEDLLKRAEAIDPDSPQLLEAWVQIDVARGTLKAAEKRLDAVIAAHPERVNPRIARALVAQEQGLLTEAVAILDEADRLGSRPELFQARVGYLARRGSPQSRDALVALIPTLARYPEDRRDELTAALAAALSQAGANNQAMELWDKLSQEHPDELRYHSDLFDLAFRTDDEAAIEKAKDRLAKAENGGGVLSTFADVGLRICQARKGQAGGLAKAKEELAEIAQKRKDWSRVDLMRAAIAETEKDADAAIDHYRLAIDHGERQIGVIRRLVQLLYERQRYAEADAQIRTLEIKTGAETASSDLKRIATDIALVTRDPQRALALAKEAVPDDSTDFRDFLWLGQVYTALDEPVQAEKQFEKAVSLGPSAPEPWIGLTAFHFRRKDQAKAEATLERAIKALPPDIGTTTIAQCYEILKRVDKADALFLQALATKPNDPATLRAVAASWLRQDRFGDAEPLLRRLLDPTVQAGASTDVPWARRQLALALVNRGGSDRFTEAMQLVDANLQADPDSSGDLITKAVVQTSRADLRSEAIKTMLKLEKIRVLEPTEDLLFCRLLEAENNWPEAHDRLVRLANRYRDRGDIVGPLVVSLIRQGDINEAAPWVEHLNRIEKDTPRSAILSAEYYRKIGQKDRALKRLQDFVQANPAQAAFAVALLDELGDETNTEPIYQRITREAKTTQEKFALALFYGRHGRFREAIDQCESLRATLPSEQVVTAALNILASGGEANAAEFKRVESWINDDTAQGNDTVDPRSLRAALYAIRGDVAGARDLYVQVLQSKPNDFTALNNLAWLLALTGTPKERDQALPLIDRAIQIVGPNPTLLDTRAVVHLALQHFDKAENDLKIAIGSQPNSPLYLYHLARVQLAKSNKTAAQQTFGKAKEFGLTLQSLDPLERPLYARVLAELQVP